MTLVFVATVTAGIDHIAVTLYNAIPRAVPNLVYPTEAKNEWTSTEELLSLMTVWCL